MLRITRSLWLTLVCVLLVALIGVGKVAAATQKRAPRKPDANGGAHVIGARAVQIARRMVGVPYRWGGASPSGFDCSGLVMFSYGRLGVKLPHSTYELIRLGRHVGRWAMKPGDLVFFYGAGHVGIYLGKSRFVHATNSGDHVRISSLKESWYASGFIGARRLIA